MESVPSAVWLDGETAGEAADRQSGLGSRPTPTPRGRSGSRWPPPAGERGPDLCRLQHPRAATAPSTRPAGRRPTPPTMPGSTPSAAPSATPRRSCSRSRTRWRTFPVTADPLTRPIPGITNATRVDDVPYAVGRWRPTRRQPLPGRRDSAWQNVGGIAETLTAADVQQAQGFFLNVSNYQYDTNSDSTAPGFRVHRLRDRERPRPRRRAGRRGRLLGNVRPERRLPWPGVSFDLTAWRLRHPVLERRRARNQHRHSGRRLQPAWR